MPFSVIEQSHDAFGMEASEKQMDELKIHFYLKLTENDPFVNVLRFFLCFTLCFIYNIQRFLSKAMSEETDLHLVLKQLVQVR